VTIKAPLLIAIVLSSTGALAQTPPSTPSAVGSKPLLQVRPRVTTDCKLVGNVRGTKLWAGDCVTPDQLRSSMPTEGVEPSLSDRAARAIPPGQQ
jgi:hypothetical protein